LRLLYRIANAKTKTKTFKDHEINRKADSFQRVQNTNERPSWCSFTQSHRVSLAIATQAKGYTNNKKIINSVKTDFLDLIDKKSLNHKHLMSFKALKSLGNLKSQKFIMNADKTMR